MKNIFIIASAFIGIIVGAGFASGQEILQYFTSFGKMGIVGAIVAAVIFAYIGMILMRLGSRLQSENHQEVINKISGRFLGKIIDYILIFVLLGIGIVMIAGSGSILNQQFGLPTMTGTILISILVIITAMTNVDRVVKVIAGLTPLLILSVIFLFLYSMFTMDVSFSSLEGTALSHDSAAGHWLISAINYVSLATVMGASMTLVMGGDEKNEKIASWGGFFGGLGVGILVIINHLTIFANVEAVGSLDMPALGIAANISNMIGGLYAIILFAMVYSSAVSMFFSFGTRFFEPKTPKFKMFVTISVVVGFITSFFGFTELVSFFYPLFGYLGMILIVILIITPFRFQLFKKKQPN
ncbi:YkvI family membrane protein [Cytobacillus purgationiresistens]|uniref:Membrane protein YkvI n=1 Tax=Cytobacillus purgationiresistens TaxID=863449 RepID=A0ABU0AB84_9BACI|nr:hypothetical protein [Cytobacillus purgationiresistens]MDQ0268508.1 putative membrane protein YkvI [Cytobacillus purgationiresistens]